jgi:hypothetical protein
MDNTAFSFLRIVKEDASHLCHFKVMQNVKLRTSTYYIDFFYKPMTKMVEIKNVTI